MTRCKGVGTVYKRRLSLFLVVVVAISLWGCAGKRFQSPIVFRSPVITEESEVDKPELPAAETPMPQEAALVESPQISEAAPEQQYRADTLRPNDIMIYTSDDLTGKPFSVLGRVTATSSDEEGFSRETALQNLKVEAFKHYGSLAQGITDIDYSTKGSLFSGSGEAFDKISGKVISLAPVTASLSQSGSAASTSRPESEAFSLEAISVVSADDLLDRSFRVLGEISLPAPEKNGFSKEQALASLKMEAFTRYGMQAKGITDVRFRKNYEMFRYRKGQAMKPPSQPDYYMNASAEVVSW